VTAPKVFLSYARVDSDKQFVSALYARLKKDGIECFFDEESLAPGANFVLQISQAINDCNYLVMIMSRAYFDARFAPAEWSAVFAKDPTNERGRLLPLLLEACDLPPLVSPLLYVDVTTMEKFEKNYPHIWQRLRQVTPNDIEQRSREIDELFDQDEVDQAIKRLLDFARDFSRQRTLVNKLTAIKAELENIKDERNAVERTKVRVELLTQALDLRDEIIGALALEAAR
jgi:hypothetical protein